MSVEKIYVTKTFLPPLEEYEKYLQRIWDSVQLTNQGGLLHEFEDRVCTYLGIDNLQLVSNGTIALQLALRALDITEGEVITTPFTYVATTEAILWERCEPVFVDIDPETFTIDPAKIEAAITDKTRAIMAVHVFGYPCDVDTIEAIAQKYNLKVIYDAAHAFGVKYKNKSLMSYGDVSICSFHATKLFHTIEGGGVTARDPALREKIELMKRFGHNGDEHMMLGINAKASEFQAAMGLCNLDYIDENIRKRKKVVSLYDTKLKGIFQTLPSDPDVQQNYAYYPVVAESETQLLSLIQKLAERNIFPRRYFYPSLNTLPYLATKQKMPISEDIASRIMCLPLYPEIPEEVVNNICEVLIDAKYVR